jgi:hypothetical protein
MLRKLIAVLSDNHTKPINRIHSITRYIALYIIKEGSAYTYVGLKTTKHDKRNRYSFWLQSGWTGFSIRLGKQYFSLQPRYYRLRRPSNLLLNWCRWLSEGTFGPKRDEVTGEWRKLHSEELHILYSSPNIIIEVGGTFGTYGRGEECVQSFDGKTTGNATTWETKA